MRANSDDQLVQLCGLRDRLKMTEEEVSENRQELVQRFDSALLKSEAQLSMSITKGYKEHTDQLVFKTLFETVSGLDTMDSFYAYINQ